MSHVMDERQAQRDALVEIVGAGHVLDDRPLSARCETDWTGRL